MLPHLFDFDQATCMAPVVNAEAPAIIAAFQQIRQSHFID